VHGTYLYGIVEGGLELPPGILGVDGISPVRVIATAGLACILSDYQGREPTSLPKEQLVKTLLAHQRVVEQAMQEGTVLPVKFGTIFREQQEALAMLKQGRSSLRGALSFASDKVEVDVAATWDSRRVIEEIGREEHIARLKETLAQRGSLALEDRVQLGQMVKASLDRRRDDYRDRIAGALRPCSLDEVSNPIISDELVLNVACLVERTRLPELEQIMQGLDQFFQGQLNFRVIGPLPLYSFATVEITPLTSEQVEEAKQALHLDGAISEAEVRKAYRRLAAQRHSAAPSHEESGTKEIDELRQASTLLVRYCHVQSGTRQERDGAFFIAIKGSKSPEIEGSRYGAPKDSGGANG